jgi:UDP-N-acetylglucosamine acyltransferase
MGGHVEVGDFVIIGGAVPIHQFVKIGKHAFIAGGFRISNYTLVNPTKAVSPNV